MRHKTVARLENKFFKTSRVTEFHCKTLLSKTPPKITNSSKNFEENRKSTKEKKLLENTIKEEVFKISEKKFSLEKIVDGVVKISKLKDFKFFK